MKASVIHGVLHTNPVVHAPLVYPPRGRGDPVALDRNVDLGRRVTGEPGGRRHPRREAGPDRKPIGREDRDLAIEALLSRPIEPLQDAQRSSTRRHRSSRRLRG